MKESAIQYTSSGAKIVYEERGKPSDQFRIELEKVGGKLVTRKIFE